MESSELVLLPPRARKMPGQMYLAAIAVKGTENLNSPKIVVYSTDTTFLKMLINEHNSKIRDLKTPKNDVD